MGFADHQAPEPSRGGRGSVLEQHLAAMPETEADAARALLDGNGTNAWVAGVFCDEGYPVSEGSVRKWRVKYGLGPYRSAS